MPFQMFFTDAETGAEYPASYWWPNDFTVNYGGRVVHARYVCHLDQQAQADGKKALPFEHHYHVEGDAFVSLMQAIASGQPSQSPLPIQIAELLDQIALQSDSFFTEATLVPVNLAVLA